ncbi:hypothetical protein C8Q75DRAFT_765927 [Abortiporus biennis]|nr:hypothetical protein C8Q75DRAFT_765927 [Abortiporus biennis]
MQTRASAKRRRDAEARGDAVTPEGELDISGEVEPQRKRNKIDSGEPSQKPKRVKRKGSLKDMPNLPLDVLFEIFSQMHPQDLLSLSRTTKAFRQLLTNKSAAYFWKASFENVDEHEPLPPRFLDLNEIQFASLLFSTHCHNCSKANVKTVIWEIKARYCNKCREDLLVPADSWSSLSSLHVADSYRSASNFLTTIYCRSRARRYRTTFFDLNEINLFKEKWRDIKSDDEETWDRILKERNDFLKENERIAKLCMIWYERKKSSRSDELDQLREERMASIIEKLQELGYEAEVDKCLNDVRRSLAEEKIVREPKPLTERAWNMLEPRAIEKMDEIRERRIADERRAALQIRIRPFEAILLSLRRKHGESNFPTPFDFMNLPRIRKIVDVPSDVSLTVEDFMNAIDPILPEIMSDWKASLTGKLLAAISTKEKIPDGTDPFTLAIGQFFRCKNCCGNGLRTYPQIYSHICQTYYQSWCGDGYTTAVYITFEWTKSTPADRFESIADHVRTIVNLAGLDAMTATAADMDNVDCKYVCISCEPNVHWSGRRIMDWRAMINHSSSSHGYGIPSVRVAREDEMKLIATLRDSYEDPINPPSLCRHCDDFVVPTHMYDLIKHLKEKHGIETDPSTKKHVIRSCDAPPVVKKPLYLMPHRMCIEGSTGYSRCQSGQAVPVDFDDLSKKIELSSIQKAEEMQADDSDTDRTPSDMEGEDIDADSTSDHMEFYF